MQKIIGINEMCNLLQKTERTIREDIRRKPQCLPPRIVVPGSSRLLWFESDVEQWLSSCRVISRQYPVNRV
jgi:predicted DNA-binding transcriptional regulator AlpA